MARHVEGMGDEVKIVPDSQPFAQPDGGDVCSPGLALMGGGLSGKRGAGNLTEGKDGNEEEVNAYMPGQK